MKATAIWTIGAVMLTATPIHAQTVRPRDVVGAAIASDIARDRQAERDAKRFPYASPGYGPIATAAAAQRLRGKGARSGGAIGAADRQARASTMSTGWEVEGDIAAADGDIPFVCSVRNGSVSGVLLRK